MAKRNIWDIIFWLILLLLAIYVVGKLVGLIQTPEWINLLPIAGIIFAAGIIYQKLTHFINTTNRKMGYIKSSLDKFIDKSIETEKKVFSLEKGQEKLFLFLKKHKG